MVRASKVLADFISKDRFELNSYLTYLFHQCDEDVPNDSSRKIIWANNRLNTN